MTTKYLTISRTILMSGVKRWLSIDNQISYHFTNSSHEWFHEMIKYLQPNILPFHELFSWVVSQDDYLLKTKYFTVSRTLLMSGVTRWLSIDNQVSYHFTNTSHEFCLKMIKYWQPKYLTISRTLLMSGVTRRLSIYNQIFYHFTNSSHEWCHKMIIYWKPNILPFHELFSWVVSQDDYVLTTKYLTISRTLLMSGVTRWLSIDNQISYHFTNTSHEWCHKMIKYWQPNILPFHELFSWVVLKDD